VKYLYLAGVLALIVLGVFAAVEFPRYLSIAKITCTSPNGPCPADMKAHLQQLVGSKLATVKMKIRAMILDNPGIDGYSLRLMLPNTVSVYILEKTPLYAIQPAQQNIFFDIDKGGVVVKIQKENNLPFVITDSKLPNVGEKVDSKLLFALSLVDSIYYSYQVIDAVVDSESLKVDLPGQLTVIFPLEGDKDALLGAFKLIVDRVHAGGPGGVTDLSKVTNIDLRFKNPVLK